MMGSVAYALCAITSLTCFALLLKAYSRNLTRLLLWSSLCFLFMAIQNIILFLDMVVIPEEDFEIWRVAAGALGPLVLLCALIWEKK